MSTSCIHLRKMSDSDQDIMWESVIVLILWCYCSRPGKYLMINICWDRIKKAESILEVVIRRTHKSSLSCLRTWRWSLLTSQKEKKDPWSRLNYVVLHFPVEVSQDNAEQKSVPPIQCLPQESTLPTFDKAVHLQLAAAPFESLQQKGWLGVVQPSPRVVAATAVNVAKTSWRMMCMMDSSAGVNVVLIYALITVELSYWYQDKSI